MFRPHKGHFFSLTAQYLKPSDGPVKAVWSLTFIAIAIIIFMIYCCYFFGININIYVYICMNMCVCIYIYVYIYIGICIYVCLCVCIYMYIYYLWLGLTLIGTMKWDLPLISGVSDLKWLHWNATLFYLNHRFEVVVTLRGKPVSFPNIKNVV